MYSLGDPSIDYVQRLVKLAGHPVRLTATEYELLYLLSTAARLVLTHELLLRRIWEPERREQPWLLRNIVKRLRRKLNDDAQNPAYIFTEPSVAYPMPASEGGRAEGWPTNRTWSFRNSGLRHSFMCRNSLAWWVGWNGQLLLAPAHCCSSLRWSHRQGLSIIVVLLIAICVLVIVSQAMRNMSIV